MFRKASPKDIPKLIELIDQIGYKIDAQKLYENLIEYGDHAFVLDLNGEILGCLAFHILPQFHSGEKHMRIVSLVVDEQHRRKGVGKQLLREAEQIAIQKGCSVMELTSAAHRMAGGAHAFYAAQGYLADGEKIYFRKHI